MNLLLIVSVILFGSITLWVINTVGKNDRLTISEHVAKSRKTIIWFGIVSSFATALASYSLFFGVLPTHHANWLSYAAFAFIMSGFLIAAVVPRTTKIRRTIHDIAAWGMCYLLPLGIISEFMWTLNFWTKTIILFAFIVSCALLILLFTVKKLRQNFLQFQLSYLGLFFISLLFITFD